MSAGAEAREEGARSPGSATLALAEALIARPSVTPDDAGCQQLIADRLRPLGFECETLQAGPDGHAVRNLWALRAGAAGGDAPVFVFAGHTDVVPPGPPASWRSDPFAPTLRDGRLYGRGAADMKSSLAAMVVAVEQFLAAFPNPRGAIALLLTSDEEGPALHGTVHVCDVLRARGQRLDWCVVGEPTSGQRLGDTVKNGRRGSLSARLQVRGVQGHVAYPQSARNPIHAVAPALAELVAERWDDGNAHFPPTTWQVSNIHAGTGASNVIPGEVAIDFNFRFSTESTPAQLEARLRAVLDRHDVDYRIDWTLGGEPFLTAPGALSQALGDAIEAETGLRPQLSTSGGTSDGRFIAKICPQVIEFGPSNASIHKIDESVAVADLDPLAAIYRRTLEALVA